MKQTQTQYPLPDLDSDPNPNPKPRRMGRVRLRRNSAAGGCGRRGGDPATPLLNWKLEDADLSSGSAPESDKGSVKERNVGWERDGVVSARKIGAGIWHVNGGLGFEPNVLDSHSSCLHASTKSEHRPPSLMIYPKNGILHKLEACGALPNPSMERATKWDPGFYSHMKLLEDQQVSIDVSSIRSELEHSRARITELELERHSAKKKLECFIQKLSEEKESWRRREHEKIRAVIDSIKDCLHRERKNRKRIEIVNTKLVDELAEAKSSAKKFSQEYGKEKKTRELMEEVCEELAKEIGDDKAVVETMKAESMRMREEVEEERQMLQMAEVWREERVQMKLIDAKVTLANKHSELSMLQAEIEAFLRARNSSDTNDEEKKKAEMLKEVVDSVKAQEIKEFSYEPPPASEGIFSVFEELQPKEETNERKIKACYGDIHDDDDDDISGWETVSHGDEQASSNSIEGSDPSVNGKFEASNALISRTNTMMQTTKEGSSIARLWRSSYQNGGEDCHRNSFEITNGRLSNGRASNSTDDLGLSSPSVREWSSPASVNPCAQINRGMKGCLEWSRGVQKQSLKGNLLEARIESQKIQLGQALKQKI